MVRHLFSSALFLIAMNLLPQGACRTQGGDDSLFFFYPHSRLIVNRTAIVANRNILYLDAGPGNLTNVRLGGILFDRFEGEIGTGGGHLRHTYGLNLRGGILTRPPLFLAASVGYYSDERREYDLLNLSFFHPADTWDRESVTHTPAPNYEGPEHWKT